MEIVLALIVFLDLTFKSEALYMTARIWSKLSIGVK